MKHSTPSERPSDEADVKQIQMAKKEGEAYHRSLQYMAKEVADSGGQKRAGDYIVAYAQERAEGMYMLDKQGKLHWTEPTDENCHIEISVSDAGDRRFIPYLGISVTLSPEGGKKIGPYEIPFVWHPGLYHYGRNIKVPGDGRYTLSVSIKPPTFMRHDKINGKRYAEKVDVEFDNIEIKTGRE
ncbi:iron transporter [Phyllobacterium sp. TAF24]|uniref:iron transporter n=1 Tax=Phyllobacterium sp. TAF24 TaxID=3233068 RepID=UPI003F96C922